MSRIGKMPIQIPSGVTAAVSNGCITVKGPKGDLSLALTPYVTVQVQDGSIHVQPNGTDKKTANIMQGTTHALVNNMVHGVSQGFNKKLEVNGVGYRAQKQGSNLVMNLGYSHKVEMVPPKGISVEVEGNVITVLGADKQAVGQFAAEVREKRPPEPYKGKGIKYVDETIIRKQGKTGKK